VDARGGSVNIIADISQATAEMTVTDVTRALVGDGSVITAGGILSVDATAIIDADVNDPGEDDGARVDTGGLGADSDTTASTTVGATTATTIGASELTGNQVRMDARIERLDALANADSQASAAGADSDASATTSTTSTAATTVKTGARITGLDGVLLSAAHDSVSTRAEALARADALFGDSDPSSSNTQTSNTSVTAEAGAFITTRDLAVIASVPVAPVAASVATKDGALIDGGSESRLRSQTVNRAIAFDATVLLAGASPILEIAADGSVVAQEIITFSRPAPGQIAIDDLSNTADLKGRAAFTIGSIALDSDTDARTTSTGALTGTPTIQVQTAFESVTVRNGSADDLIINDIDVLGTAGTPDIAVTALDASGFQPVVTSDPGATPLTVESAASGDILLAGRVYNPFGSTTYATAGGDIVDAVADNAAAKVTVTDRLVLEAPAGRIGDATDPIRVATNVLTARALGDIRIDERAGDVALIEVTSTAGDVVLSADGSVLDGSDNEAPKVGGERIVLLSRTGGIGTTDNALEIDARAGEGGLAVLAETDVAVVDVVGALSIADVTVTSGDISLGTRDAVAPGQDLMLLNGARVRAFQGSIRLFAGDDVLIDPSSRVVAQQGRVQLDADWNEADDVDPGVGATIDLQGTILATEVTIQGGDNRDLIIVPNVQPGTPTTIIGGVGDDTILLGSAASPAGNVGGTLATIKAAVTVVGGLGNDVLHLDGTGDTAGVTGTVGATEIAGFGLAATVGYAGIADLILALGAGNDVVRVDGTAAGTDTWINTGAGADRVEVGSPRGTVNDVAGLLILDGGGNGGGNGGDRLIVDDTNDPDANAGRLDGARLTGLGMGSADQTVIDAARGITFAGFAVHEIRLGTGDDAFTVAAVDAGTATTLDAGAGDDTVTVGDRLDRILAPLTLSGGDGSDDRLIVATAIASDIVLDRSAAAAAW
jgi:trimeric autotransporter adhesin